MTAPARFRFPVSLDLTARACVVVGGGTVAARKVRGLLDAGASATVVSPRLSPDLLDLAREERVRWIPREYRRGDLAGAWLVMIATDSPTVNVAAAAEARELRIWANCADDPERCDFSLPAIVRRGPLAVAVSTGGASPAVAQVVREEIERRLTSDWTALTELVAEVRRELRTRGIAPAGLRWRAAIDDELRVLVAAGRDAEARARLRERLGA